MDGCVYKPVISCSSLVATEMSTRYSDS